MGQVFDSEGDCYVCVAVGFILCHPALNSDAAALSLWKLALQSSTCLCLFRDEVFHIHKAAEDLFVNIRGWGPQFPSNRKTHFKCRLISQIQKYKEVKSFFLREMF